MSCTILRPNKDGTWTEWTSPTPVFTDEAIDLILEMFNISEEEDAPVPEPSKF